MEGVVPMRERWRMRGWADFSVVRQLDWEELVYGCSFTNYQLSSRQLLLGGITPRGNIHASKPVIVLFY